MKYSWNWRHKQLEPDTSGANSYFYDINGNKTAVRGFKYCTVYLLGIIVYFNLYAQSIKNQLENYCNSKLFINYYWEIFLKNTTSIRILVIAWRLVGLEAVAALCIFCFSFQYLQYQHFRFLLCLSCFSCTMIMINDDVLIAGLYCMDIRNNTIQSSN